MWTKQPPTEKVHIIDVRPKVIKGKNKVVKSGVTRPMYDIKKVFKTN